MQCIIFQNWPSIHNFTKLDHFKSIEHTLQILDISTLARALTKWPFGFERVPIVNNHCEICVCNVFVKRKMSRSVSHRDKSFRLNFSMMRNRMTATLFRKVYTSIIFHCGGFHIFLKSVHWLELRQCKNDSTAPKNRLVLKLPRFFPHRIGE